MLLKNIWRWHSIKNNTADCKLMRDREVLKQHSHTNIYERREEEKKKELAAWQDLFNILKSAFYFSVDALYVWYLIISKS